MQIYSGLIEGCPLFGHSFLIVGLRLTGYVRTPLHKFCWLKLYLLRTIVSRRQVCAIVLTEFNVAIVYDFNG